MACGNLHARHWFTVYGFPRLRAPYCVRGCGTPNPRPLTGQELREYNYVTGQRDKA